MGFVENSYRTPTGRFRISQKIGGGEPCHVTVLAHEHDVAAVEGHRVDGIPARRPDRPRDVGARVRRARRQVEHDGSVAGGHQIGGRQHIDRRHTGPRRTVRAGDQVVTAGQNRLTSGATVTIDNSVNPLPTTALAD